MSDEFPLPEPPSRNSNVYAVELLSGSFGGAAQVIVGQPLDTLKTRAQTAPAGKFKNTWDILRQTVRKEGVLALYKGMMSPLMGVAAVNSLLFTAYGTARRIVSPYPDLSIPQVMLAGSMAGAANAILASPVEMFKIRMQGQYGGAGDKKLSGVVRDMWQQYGFRNGIMRGYWITFIKEIPAYAGFYGCYEVVKRFWGRRFGGTENIPVWALLVSGACGGVGYWLASYPLDIAKSRIQLADKPPMKGHWLQGGYVVKELKTIVAEGGVKALFRGIGPSLVRAVPAAGSTFVAFEVTRDYITRHGLL
ncbi:hypothetical protein CspeluHIS016_0601560 [Cutaneotrichosporon spelunceum]|uniref:Mitochondrial carrier n=1 Tax=Cutaneotrichosporon spelunceum TaxID=1672016 RepID=A0AAD3TY88_9TREE|nr:hypothetical protein CspeluHIS016_0601560 [Cutaneotrichosporon spelunceum]